MFARIFSLSLPVAMGYIPLGMVFGFLFVQAGGNWQAAGIMSLFVFAGAAQFMVVPMLAAKLSFVSIALATFVVNLRHIFYGLSLLHRQPKSRLARFYLIWALTDESYSLITSSAQKTSDKEVVTLVALNHSWWILGTFLGAGLATQVPQAINGLEFSLAALFAVLTLEQWRSRRQSAPLLLGVVCYALSVWLVPENALLTAISLLVVAASFYLIKKEPKA